MSVSWVFILAIFCLKNETIVTVIQSPPFRKYWKCPTQAAGMQGGSTHFAELFSRLTNLGNKLEANTNPSHTSNAIDRRWSFIPEPCGAETRRCPPLAHSETPPPPSRPELASALEPRLGPRRPLEGESRRWSSGSSAGSAKTARSSS